MSRGEVKGVELDVVVAYHLTAPCEATAMSLSEPPAKKAAAPRRPGDGRYWIWVPIFHALAVDLVANIYLPLVKGQLGFPGPFFAATMMLAFISWPLTVPAAIVADAIKGKSATIQAATSAAYAIALGAVVVWVPSPPPASSISSIDLVVIFWLGPTALLTWIGWRRGRSIDAAKDALVMGE